MDLSERGASDLRHPWELERFRAYRHLLRQHAIGAAERVLDVGAGDGWFAQHLLSDLTAAHEIVCWDVNYDALDLVESDPRLRRTTTCPGGAFDAVLVLDVLEHVDDPRRFVLDELASTTRAGSLVLVSVPAHPALFGAHDRALGHHRRYRRSELRADLAGWIDIAHEGSLFWSLVPARAAAIGVERLRRRRAGSGLPAATAEAVHGVGEWRGGRIVTGAVRAVLASDVAIGRAVRRVGVDLPGLSYWALGRAR